MRNPDVAVIGGGAIGLAVAWRAASAGLSVALVDDLPGRGASWAAAGMLAPVTEAHYGERSLLELNLASSEKWPAFAEELEEVSGRSIGYRRCGTLAVARDADDNVALEDLYRYQKDLGLEVERLKGSECRELEPALAPSVRGGILVPGDHQVDNRALVTALQEACTRAGVAFVAARARELLFVDDRLEAVGLGNGESLKCGRAVLAAGCWSGSIEGLPASLRPPVRPVKGQVLVLKGPRRDPLLSRNVRGLEVYLVPRTDGRLILGATVEEMGFDVRVSAGGVYALLRDAYELVPGITELELLETVVGLRPGSPDNAPLLGPIAEGLVLATGHYRNGILLTPATADAIARILVADAVPHLIQPFAPQRLRPAEVVS